MTHAVVFTPFAERQLDTLHRYISIESGESRADAYIDRIITYCEGFATFPIRGTKRDEILAGLRTVGFERRVTIAFTVTETAVLIEGVFYGGRDFEALLRERSR